MAGGGVVGQGSGQARVSPLQSVALTEAGLWPYRGESCRGEWGGGRRAASTTLGSVVRAGSRLPFQHMAKALGLSGGGKK